MLEDLCEQFDHLQYIFMYTLLKMAVLSILTSTLVSFILISYSFFDDSFEML
jgi:hypothetical protein